MADASQIFGVASYVDPNVPIPQKELIYETWFRESPIFKNSTERTPDYPDQRKSTPKLVLVGVLDAGHAECVQEHVE